MNYRITTPCEKYYQNCYRGLQRVYASKADAMAACQNLNEAMDQERGLIGTFSFYETKLPVDEVTPQPAVVANDVAGDDQQPAMGG